MAATPWRTIASNSAMCRDSARTAFMDGFGSPTSPQRVQELPGTGRLAHSRADARAEILRGVLQAEVRASGLPAANRRVHEDHQRRAEKAGARSRSVSPTSSRRRWEEVDRIRRDAAALKLSGLQSAARDFEDALQDLRSRETLSGATFCRWRQARLLVRTIRLLRSLTSQAGPSREAEAVTPEAAHHRERHAVHRSAEVPR